MSEAQRLADDLDTEFVSGRVSNHTARKAAAELRRLAPMEAELAVTHKALAEAVLNAEQGWSRYENANRLSNSLQEELAALRAAVPAIPARRELDATALHDLIAEHLRGTFHCTRVWSAWSYGTMSEDDFGPVDESDTPQEITDAVIAMIEASPQAPQAAQPVRVKMDEWMERLLCRATTPPGFKQGEAHMVTEKQVAELRQQIMEAAQPTGAVLNTTDEPRPGVGSI
jgi:hypothetical protein